MTVRNQNVKIYRGNTVSLSVAVTQADGSAYDPTLGAQFRYRVAKTSHATDDEAMVRKALNDGIASVTGGVTITLGPDDTNFDPGVYYHELRVADGNDVSTAMIGAFVIKPAVQMGDKITPIKFDLKLSGTIPTRAP